MILLMLIARCKDDQTYMWIEDITLFSYDISFRWITLMLRIFYSLSVISESVDLVELEDIQFFMIDS